MKKSIIPSLFALAALAPAASFASDGTITFSGSIEPTTCVIKGGTPSFAVTLPKVSTTAFSESRAAGAKTFTIELTSCSENRGVRAYFERGPNDFNGSGGYLKNNGTAKNVVVQLKSLNGSPLGQITTGTEDQGGFVAISDGAATLQYLAQYFATGTDTPTTGTVTTSVTYSLQFQ